VNTVRGIVGLIRLATVLVGGGIVVAFTLAALGPRIAEIYSANESTVAEVNLDELALRSVVYDTNGDEFDVLYDVENRQLVTLDDVSDAMLAAVIAVEDEGFYEHNGIDAKAIGRAFIRNVNAGGIEEGGSTITQQLIKNGVVGDDQVIDRKIAEAAVARRLEQQMSKEEILEAYLNTVYFGGGAYGVWAASEIYFGTTPNRLDYAQSALLAGLIANPSKFDPTLRPDLARERRDIALSRLVAVGELDEEEAAFWRAVPVPTTRTLPSEWQPDNYFIEEVRRQLLDDFRLGETPAERAEALFGGGLRVYTTYDPAAQAAAEAARDRFASDDDRVFISALASVEPGTGRVRALVGGPGFEVPGFGEYNIATQKGRPTGSSFKPFVLAAAMEKGLVPADQINGRATCRFDNPGGSPDPYAANNFGGSGTGSVRSIRSQTLASSNCAYLRLGQIVGLSNVADTARALGVTSDLSSLPISMPLGPLDVTPLDMATAFATFANDGLQVDPIFIDRVEDRAGNVLILNEPIPQRAISVQSARLVTSVLEANVRGGTGTRAQLPDQVAAGKTGTGQDFKNAWFVGFTPHLSTAVWMGNPFGQGDETKMRGVRIPELGVRNVTGGSAPAAIWQAFNEVYHADREPLTFTDPAPTRSGRRVRTDDEEDSYNNVVNSVCGDRASEVDEDEDGVVDFCENSGFTYDPQVGRCPSLLVPFDENEDGKIDSCISPTTTTTTTTTMPTITTPSITTPSTTPPPITTSTTLPPTTTSTTLPPPTSSTTLPPPTSSTTTPPTLPPPDDD
jgi:membrane peptidoglycan carboxypeptidase